MSWWDISENRGVTGDQPADFVMEMFADIEKTRGKPTFQQALDAAATAIRRWRDELTDGAPFRRLKVQVISKEYVHSSDEESGDAELVELFHKWFAEIARVYQRRWERKPTPSELAYALCFVMRADTSDYVSDAPPPAIRDFYVE